MTVAANPREGSVRSSVMPAFAQPFAAEDHHFWFRARNRLIGRLVQRLTEPLPPGYRVLEVGAGTGNVLRVLEQTCRTGAVIGSDLFDEGLHYARQRVACRLVRADVYRLPFATPFDLIGIFDVLEHLPDDHRALHDALAPGGRLLLTVPAHMTLWSHVDVSAGHYRRYGPAALASALGAAGFRVDLLTPFMMPLAPLMWLGRRFAAWRNRFTKADTSPRDMALREFETGAMLNVGLEWLLAWEASWVARGWRLPFGSSLVAVATRPMNSPLRAAA